MIRSFLLIICYLLLMEQSWAASDVEINSGANVQVINDTTVINHHTKSGSTVSYIDAARFSVHEEGLAFNNNAGSEAIQSNLPLLITPVDPNLNLLGGEASIIYTEVTSNRRSRLYGPIEILGGNAEFVLANPNGIRCEGCGFWRTPGYGNDSKENISKVILGVGSLYQNDGAGATLLRNLESIDPSKVVLRVERNVSGGKERSYLIINLFASKTVPFAELIVTLRACAYKRPDAAFKLTPSRASVLPVKMIAASLS